MTAQVEIALFARAPVAGGAKTRLIPALGAEGAARLHARLVRRALAQCKATGLRTTLHMAGAPDHPFFAACARDFDVTLVPQEEGDLGARMHAAFIRARGPLLLMGSDCPPIDAQMLRACAQSLLQRDAVFLPAEDGGYGLVGLNRPQAHLFENMPWGTSAVMAVTREKCAGAGLTWDEPFVIWDVDTPEDLERLRRSPCASIVHLNDDAPIAKG